MTLSLLTNLATAVTPLPEAPAMLPGVPMWWYVTALLLAAVLLGIAKSGFAGGIGILAVPLTANVLPPDATLAVMLPILIVGDIFAATLHYRRVQWHTLWPMFGGAAAGIAVGAVALTFLTDPRVLNTALNLSVGGICLLIVAVQAWRLVGGSLPHVPATRTSGITVGGVSGVVSTLAHSAGPIAAVYLLEIKLDKARFVATAAWFFLLVNSAKVPPYLLLGLITPTTLWQSAWAALAVPVGAMLGLWMYKRVPEKPFAAIVYISAAIAAGRMIWMAVG